VTLCRIKKRSTERIRVCGIKDGKENEAAERRYLRIERRYLRIERRRKKKGGGDGNTRTG
jgi:hypothetical protein